MKLPFKPDPYIVGILVSVALAIVLPIHGWAVAPFGWLIKVAVALLFFLYGARLPREVVIAGLTRWRLHLTTLAIVFAVYPLFGFLWPHLPAWLLAPALVPGMIYLCCMPSTIQSNVVLVASARGDVAAALCSASASQMVGIVASPLLVGLLLHAKGAGVSLQAIEGIVLQLLLPFVLGQALHPKLGAWCEKNRKGLAWYDRLTIYLIVYAAFSAAMVGGVWRQVGSLQLLMLALVCAVFLAVMMLLALAAARLGRFRTEDEVVILFCGVQKGMAAGIPMASLIFPPAAVGMIVLPLMIYHQFQLITCAVLAGRYARRPA